MKGEGKEDEQSRSHSGSVVVVPAAVLFQPLEMIEWEEGPDKGTDQKTSTPCWKRRRGGWLNSPLLLSKQIEGNIIGDSDKAVIAIQEWRPADQGKERRQLLKGEGEEENWRLVDPFDTKGASQESSCSWGKTSMNRLGKPSWDESGRIEASPLGQVWAGTKGASSNSSCSWGKTSLNQLGEIEDCDGNNGNQGEEGVDDGVVGSLLRLEAGLISGTPGCGESLRMRRRLIKGKRKMIVTCC
ncbi:hypothetical protein BY996DRAFT_6596981 [Phakopsora pachyrhizi]|nr:hypothetical protein BY996DRAFT_6596981 [Phakopsora pachyrhizi]